jgi:serine/threonine-protein kinase
MKQKINNNFICNFMMGVASLSLLSACGGGSNETSYLIGGTVEGLDTGAQVELMNNGSDSRMLVANGVFSFATLIPQNANYSVTVHKQPVGQTCSVINGAGTALANVTNVAVFCVDNSVMVSTFSGSGQPGSSNGNGGLASFKNPYHVAADSKGNVYVADWGNNLIRKISPEGETSIFAGSGIAGADDGPGASASFKNPTGVTVATNGTVFVADWGNHNIRAISPEGNVTTLAGASTVGYKDSTGKEAMFKSPYGVAVDASGNVYVADSGNYVIRKITASGVVTTLAGSRRATFADGLGKDASFKSPRHVAVDSKGNVYVADSGNNRIRKVAQDGLVTTVAGSATVGSSNGVGDAASFNVPDGVAVDAGGNVYVADTGNNLIRKIALDGKVTTLAGSGVSGSSNGVAGEASFNNPRGIAIDTGGALYVADYENNLIRKITGAASK